MGSLITLTTDFGHSDHYVGAMKGVIASINPDAVVLDITHGIPPFDVMRGALALRAAAPYFPAGTIHVVVVDPGVGGERRPIAVKAGGFVLVGPDNGVLSLMYPEGEAPEARLIENPDFMLEHVSSTFHGRDVFAPAAAHLSRGRPFVEVGRPVRDLQRLAVPSPCRREGLIVGRVLYVDSFGNLVTNIPSDGVDDVAVVEVEGRALRGVLPSYAYAPRGELAAVRGSTGLVEIAANMGDAARMLGVSADEVRRGRVVEVRVRLAGLGE